MLREGHVGGHNDELIVSTKDATALVLEIYGIALEVLEKGGMRHTSLKLELIPADDGVDPVGVTREPVGHVHVVYGVVTLEGIEEGGLADIWRTYQKKLFGFEGPTATVGGDLIEEIYDKGVALPAIKRT